jgi:predicted ATPase/class 3 adenylate cyclase
MSGQRSPAGGANKWLVMPVAEEPLAFLFTDIEGSTARWEAHPDAMREAIARHDELMRTAIQAHGGKVFKTVGDAFCAVFPSNADAVSAAADAQRAIAASDWSAIDGLRVRMAINFGPAEERGHDYFGPTLNRVARLLSVAYGGQVLLTDEGARGLDALGERVSLRDLGFHRLKDLPQPQKIYQLLAKGLRVEFPPVRSVESHPTNIPRQLTTFLGREEELAALTDMVTSTHLVTITGAGGVGKTQTALHAAIRVHDRFADGAWLVELAALSGGELVPGAIAAVFGIEELSRDRPLIDDITFALKGKHALIVFDNCEHVVTAVAKTVEHLLKNCPNLTILATSREPLAISAERTFRMPTLPENTAVELFAERARAANSKFLLTEANRNIVAEIVRRLDGIPLAIELAASRVKVLRVEQINSGLQQRFKLLTGGSRTALPRQQTLQALIGWSYDLLSDAERSMLCQLAVFRGGCTLPAVFEVCADERYPEWDAISLLESLVEKSLVVVESSEIETRYRLLESTREYALARLNEDRELAEAAIDRHARFFAEESARAFDSFWETNSQEWEAAMQPDLDNYRAAIDALLSGRDVVAGVKLVANVTPARLYEILDMLARAAAIPPSELPREVYGRLQVARARRGGDEGVTYEFAAEALEIFSATENVPLRIEAQVRLAGSLFRMGKVDEAIAQCEPALALARSAGIDRLVAFAASQLALFVTEKGDAQSGMRLDEEAAGLLRSLGDRVRLRSVLINMAEVQFAAGAADDALRSVDEALSLALEAGWAERRVMVCHLNAASYLLALERIDEAYERARAALEISVRIKRGLISAIAIGHLARIAAAHGEYERAARLMGYVDAVYSGRGIVREHTEAVGYDEAMKALASQLSQERLAELLAEGAKLSQDAAVAMAMAFTLPIAAAQIPG